MPELADNLHFSEKVENLKPSGIRIFDNKVSEIPNIIKLTLGEPDLNTPEHVKSFFTTSSNFSAVSLKSSLAVFTKEY